MLSGETYSQQDVMLEVRRPLAEILAHAHRCSQCTFFQFWRRRTLRHRFQFARPGHRGARGYADELMKRSQTLGGIVDADTSLKLNKPELRVEIDRARAADLGVDQHRHCTALRLMVGGEDRASRYRDESINEDYDVTTPPRREGPQRRRDHPTSLRALIARRLVRLE